VKRKRKSRQSRAKNRQYFPLLLIRNLLSDVLLLAPSLSAPSVKIAKGILRWLSPKRRRERGNFLGFVCCVCLIVSSSRRVTTTLSAAKAMPYVNLPFVFLLLYLHDCWSRKKTASDWASDSDVDGDIE
jgi:hypothetical protein